MSDAIAPLYAGPAGAVWRQFAALSAIPRPSKHEEAVRRYLLAEGRQHGWECRTDAVGNVVLAVPGAGALANEPPLILQSHMDMVCEKNREVVHDFQRDPLRLIIADGWVKAVGTTLGADNGIGVALSLALAAEVGPDRLPLELLVTVDEETGLTGALGLDPAIVTGRHVLNLDSEEDWLFIIGCAGGVDMVASFPLTRLSTPPSAAWSVELRGLRGGHSGVNIHEDRGNANQALAELLGGLDGEVHALDGGNKRNAIPRESRAIVSGVTQARLPLAAAALERQLRADGEVGAMVTVAPAAAPLTRVDPAAIAFLRQAANGVIAWDRHFPDLVKTSNNLSVVAHEGDRLAVRMHGRSSVEAEKDALVGSLRELTSRLGGEFAAEGRYPGWEPCPDSALLRRGKALFRQQFGKEPGILSIHAGLEAGIIGAKLGTRELLSYGPTILDPHSPDERLEIASVDRAWKLLCAFVSAPLSSVDENFFKA